MSAITKSITLALAASFLLVGQASAATYKLPIIGGSEILKIYLNNGKAHRVGLKRGTATFEMEMNGSECMADLRLAFSDGASPLRVRYDVCSEKGFGLTRRTIRF